MDVDASARVQQQLALHCRGELSLGHPGGM